MEAGYRNTGQHDIGRGRSRDYLTAKQKTVKLLGAMGTSIN
jgi:hypothetical protein